jgi:hypothetical protein
MKRFTNISGSAVEARESWRLGEHNWSDGRGIRDDGK